MVVVPWFQQLLVSHWRWLNLKSPQATTAANSNEHLTSFYEVFILSIGKAGVLTCSAEKLVPHSCVRKAVKLELRAVLSLTF